MAKKNEVAEVKAEAFNLMTLDGELAQAVSEEMDGLGTIPFDRVKIPSGGSLAFEIPGDTEEETESATELVGVILDHNPINAYWAEKFAGGNESPDCSSYDGKQGVERETGETHYCEYCPHNQYGSDGDGKACKNMHRVYILRENNPVPILLTLPPTSLKPMRDYIGKRILLKGFRCWQVITKITLKKEKNKAGIVYSRAAFGFVDRLTDGQIKATENMRDMIKAIYKDISIDGDEYTVPADGTTAQAAPQPDKDGFIEIPESDCSELPFN